MNQETTTIIKLMITASRTHEVHIAGEYTKDAHRRYFDALENATDINDAISILAEEGAKVIGFDPAGKLAESIVEPFEVGRKKVIRA